MTKPKKDEMDSRRFKSLIWFSMTRNATGLYVFNAALLYFITLYISVFTEDITLIDHNYKEQLECISYFGKGTMLTDSSCINA